MIMTSNRTSLLVLALALLVVGSSNAFTTPQNKYRVSTPTELRAFQRSSPSRDSVNFLRRPTSKKNRRHRGHTDTSAEGDPPAANGIENKGEDPEVKNSKSEKKGYQRVEDWDKEQKAGALSWDQKVQFDGLRMGNGFRQNEILQRALNSF